MKKSLLKKVLITLASVIGLFVIILSVHIYQVTHKKITDPNAIALARIDFNQSFTQEQAADFSNWFNTQNGINRSVFNVEYKNAVIAYYPVKTNATEVIATFCKKFNVDAKRYLPSKQEMMKGCPVAMN